MQYNFTTIKNNPGLEPYDISSYKGAHGKNFYLIDTALRRMIQRYTKDFSSEHKEAIENHLIGFGELVGGILNQLTIACHKEGKYGELVKYDKVGNRIDEIVYSPEQIESRRIHYEYGIVNLDFHSNWKYTFPHIHRYALAYLANLNGEAGVTCPLAMTDGLILALKQLGTEDQKKKYLPLIAGEKSTSYFMCGQYVTERVGGSNVAANRTIAKRLDNGKWLLIGEKWFCSNPGDLWVTTAKIEGTNTIGMFLVPRFKEDGSLNNHHIIRKKDIIGSRGKVTAEVIYDGVEAEELGRPSHGLANMLKYIIKTSRIHVGIGACGNARRAVMEALEYANYRTAYGKKILEFPAYYRLLVEMIVLQTANIFANFAMVDAAEKNSILEEAWIPLLKYKSSSQATYICKTAILCLGGNGIIGDFSPIPRLLNDSIINESWEGTHLIITGHFLHAMNKKKIQQAMLDELQNNLRGFEKVKELEYPIYVFNKKLNEWNDLMNMDKNWKECNRVYLSDLAYELLTISLMVREAIEDIQSGKEKSIYQLMSNSLAEIYDKGIHGHRDPSKPILNYQLSREILRY